MSRIKDETLESNLHDPKQPTTKQVGYLLARCREHNKTAGNLIAEALQVGRLHQDRISIVEREPLLGAGYEESLLYELTRSEVGALFEITSSWTTHDSFEEDLSV